MDFTDEERQVLFESTMGKLGKAIDDLSIVEGNNRRYNGIYEYFLEILGDGFFDGRDDRTLADFSVLMDERKAKLEKAKELLHRAEQFFSSGDDRDSLESRTLLIAKKRRMAICEAENDCGSALIQLAEDISKAIGKDFKELTCREVVDYITEPVSLTKKTRSFWRY